MPPFRRILTSGFMSCLVIAGLALLADGSTRAQLDRALRLPAFEATLQETETRAPSGRGLDRRRLEATVLMVSPEQEP